MFICTSCGTQYADSDLPPSSCPICCADGDPVPEPRWTTLDAMRPRYQNLVQRLEPDLFSVRSIPAFSSGRRALLLRSAHGNILWGCVTLIDQPTIRTLRALGGLAAIAVSHPRHFASMIEWSRAFGGVPVYVHATSHRWVMRSERVVRLWEGNALGLLDEVTLIHVSTYNQGGTMLHWPAGAGGGGALLTGDVIQVLAQRQRVGFLSNPRDLVPRAAECVRRLVSAVEPMSFEAVHDALADGSIEHDARAIVLRSAASYVAALSGQTDVKDPRCSMIA
jgi:hypothetical protein